MNRIPVRKAAVFSAAAVVALGTTAGVAVATSGPSGGKQQVAVGDVAAFDKLPIGQQELLLGAAAKQSGLAFAKDAAAKAAAQQAAAAKAAALKAQQAAAAAAAQRAAAAAQASRDAQRAALEAQQQAAASPSPTPSSDSGSSSSGSSGSGSGSGASPSEARAIAQQIVPAGQFSCFDWIIERESGYNVYATNPSSGAYGIPQALPGSKMASAGPDWQNSATTQIEWALQYMDDSYGSPCGAESFWESHGWY